MPLYAVYFKVAGWATEALLGLGKGAPFSLYLTEKHFSEVVAAQGNNDHSLSQVRNFCTQID